MIYLLPNYFILQRLRWTRFNINIKILVPSYINNGMQYAKIDKYKQAAGVKPSEQYFIHR